MSATLISVYVIAVTIMTNLVTVLLQYTDDEMICETLLRYLLLVYLSRPGLIAGKIVRVIINNIN